MIYLATPYSDPDPEVRQRRYDVVTLVAAKLVSENKMVVSPITHSHPIAKADGSWEYCEAFDRKLMSICDTLMVLKQPGWEESIGVKCELGLAAELGMRIEYKFPIDILDRCNLCQELSFDSLCPTCEEITRERIDHVETR